MDFNKYSELYKDFVLSSQEMDTLKSLFKLAKKRYENSAHAIANSFIHRGDSSIVFSIDEIQISEYLKKMPICKIARVPGAKEVVKQPLYFCLKYLKEQSPEFFTGGGEIAITTTVQKDFDRIEELKNDAWESLSLFDSRPNDVKINIYIDENIEGKLFMGGMLLKFIKELGNDDVAEPMDEITISCKTPKIVINRVPSHDMVNFIREVIKEYVKRHPGITLKQLQQDLSFMHNGPMFKFVEEKSKIKKLSEENKRVYFSFNFTGKLDDGTEYVIYNQLNRNNELPKIIEFAKRHGII